MTSIRVPVDIDEKAFWKLAAVAEEHDMKVPDFLAELAITASRRHDPTAMNPVVQRWGMGMTDRQIAAELNMTNAAVADKRRSFGLPANSTRRNK